VNTSVARSARSRLRLSPSSPVWPGLLFGATLLAAVLPRPLPGAPLLVVVLALCGLAFVVALRRIDRSSCRPWQAVALGISLIGAGVAVEAFGLEGDAAAFVGGLIAAGNVVVAIGVLTLLRPAGHGLDLAIVLEAALLAVAVSMLAWFLLVQPHFDAIGVGRDWLDASLATCFVSFDIVFVAIAVNAWWSQGGLSVAQRLLLVALATAAVTDVTEFLAAAGVAAPLGGRVADVGLSLAVPIVAAAALHPSASRRPRFGRRGRDQRVLGARLLAVAACLFIPAAGMIRFGYDEVVHGHLETPAGMPPVVIQLGVMCAVFAGLVTLRLVLAVERLEKVLQVRDGLERELKQQALADPLTTLPNRAAFTQRLAEVLKTEPPAAIAVMFCDLDDFKSVNDTLGHHAGDDLLKTAARRLLSAIRPTDMAARLGGDEFAVLLIGLDQAGTADQIARRILDSFAQPFRLAGTLAAVRMSIGVAMGTDAAGADELMQAADIAMYLAKTEGKGRAERFRPELRDRVVDRMELQNDLGLAIERNQLSLVYQPIASLESDGIVALEALLRWEHPERGAITPSEFIPLAERTGLIVEIGRWVLVTACRQMRAWLDAGAPRDTHVSVNVSAVQVGADGFVAEALEILWQTGISPRNVMIELTESALVDATLATQVLSDLKKHGFRIAIDDFGTGYSAMSYLTSFPIDVLKIDRSFVNRMSADEQGRLMVQTILRLARNLELDTVAEGIEDASQLAELASYGCRFGQGYLLGRPTAASSAGAWFGAGGAVHADPDPADARALARA
jgi:diguanylate cyclase